MKLELTAKEIVELACLLRDAGMCPADVGNSAVCHDSDADSADIWTDWFQSREVK